MNRPQETPTELDYAWAAGFFDGEGYIGVTGKKSERLRMSVVGTDPRPLLRFRKLFGGAIHSVEMRKYMANAKNRFTWEAAGWGVARLMEHMLPYLHVKREQAEIAIRYMATFGNGNVSEDDPRYLIRQECDRLLRELKTREFALDTCKDKDR